jgi:hypothetical protein
MRVDEIVRRARLDRAPMRVRTFRLTDGQYGGLNLLARRHGVSRKEGVI